MTMDHGCDHIAVFSYGDCFCDEYGRGYGAMPAMDIAVAMEMATTKEMASNSYNNGYG